MMAFDEIAIYMDDPYAKVSIMSYVHIGLSMEEAVAYAYRECTDSELARMLETSEHEAAAIRDHAMSLMDAYAETHVRRDVDMDDPSIWAEPDWEGIRREREERIANNTANPPQSKPRLAARIRGTFSRKC